MNSAETTDIAVSSLTYTIKGQKLLERYGFVVWAGRDHERTTGCGYKLTVKGDADRARALLIAHGIKLAKEETEPSKGGDEG